MRVSAPFRGEDRARRHASASAYSRPVQAYGRGIRKWIARGTGLALLVALPALFARPWADERIYLFWPEHIAGRNPLLLIDRVIREIPGYLELGVFRWLSRLLTFFENWALVRTSLAVGLPANVLRAIPKALMVLLMCTVLFKTFRQYRLAGNEPSASPTWNTLLATATVTFAASLTIFSPPLHPLTLFPTLYLGTAGLAMAIPLMLGRMRLEELRSLPMKRPLGAITALAYTFLGAAIASMIELAYLAIPLAALHVILIEGLAKGDFRESWRRLTGSRVTKAFAALAVGFLAVFVPVRIMISRLCADGGCYAAADPVVGRALWETWPVRMIAGAFPVLQVQQMNVAFRALRVSREVWVLAVVVAAVTAWTLRHALRRGASPPRSDRRWLVAIAIYWSAVLLLASLLSSLSRATQDQDLGLAPWRESGFTWVAWTALLATALTLLIDRAGILLRVGAAVLLVAGVFLASVQNQADLARVRSSIASRQHNQIALLVVEFDRTPAGNLQRCNLINEILMSAGSDSERQKMELLNDSLETLAVNHHGVSFCAK